MIELENLIYARVRKKRELQKYKEDVEQVELFGMERNDYEQKKALCVQLIQELKELDRQIAELQAQEEAD